ncbi:MAG: hypothetical protein OMM_14969 [Candidatus Magnetoglobus multicellularis str. Araruama]|uniref:Uncharacterized protein n=1 Tax=Candidatus Magnetoglobus multicellularis str. Araruama TaxID=890399 RepID=A0A1V1NR09_9BACT|nr:MAG: hypothetical protein OMM_14969 [Candidatus Magnetoglobus multicellularis str. Araruama]
MTKKELQKNQEFRKILKKFKIGWREFMDYGFITPVQEYRWISGKCQEKYHIGMGKWNGIYDFYLTEIWGDLL